jgi:hypothetical protein
VKSNLQISVILPNIFIDYQKGIAIRIRIEIISEILETANGGGGEGGVLTSKMKIMHKPIFAMQN